MYATTIEDLEARPTLTPEAFAGCFRDFAFAFHHDLQSPDLFLVTRSGDCDDFSILAARVLRPRGYTPRLIAVRMAKVVHVVCYIEERGSYLDYNERTSGSLVKSGRRISDIARSVAKSYGTEWVSASEFTSDGALKRLVQTVLKRDDRQMAAILR